MPPKKRGKVQAKDQNQQRPVTRKKQVINFDDDDDNFSEEEADGEEGYASSDEDQHKRRKNPSDDVDSEDEKNFESLDAKRIRLAREYIKKVDEQSSSSDDSSSEEEDEDKQLNPGNNTKLAEKLARGRLKRTGALERVVVSGVKTYLDSLHEQISSNCVCNNQNYSSMIPEIQSKTWQQFDITSSSGTNSQQHPIVYLKGHDLTVTCVALEANGTVAYSGSKDNSVLCWDMEKECCKSTVLPHWKHNKNKKTTTGARAGEVLAVAASDDGRYLAVGGRDALVKIFDVRLSSNNGKDGNGAVATFRGHKGPITCLAFRSQSLQLFSGSEDRCIRYYSLEEKAYVETLYGHQSGITGIDCYLKERPITIGRDRTARAWKVAEETHLIFRGGSKALAADCISCIKDDWFVTGNEDGNMSLWSTEKKKAVATVQAAHGPKSPMIVCCDALKGSDLAASGSNDGYMRLWKVHTGKSSSEQGIENFASIPIHGFVNGLAIGPRARFCVAAVGQEHRLGRWERVAGARNRLAIIRLRSAEESIRDEDEDATAEEIGASKEEEGHNDVTDSDEDSPESD